MKYNWKLVGRVQDVSEACDKPYMFLMKQPHFNCKYSVTARKYFLNYKYRIGRRITRTQNFKRYTLTNTTFNHTEVA